MTKQMQPVLLSQIKAGTKVKLIKIQAGENMRHRLAAMGLLPRGIFAVITAGQAGPIVVEVKGTRVALGRGMVNKMFVIKETPTNKSGG